MLGERPVNAPPLLGRSPGTGGHQQPGGWAGPGWREPVPEVGGGDATPFHLAGPLPPASGSFSPAAPQLLG